MSSCVFPGSFDPVTRGHMDLIQRASKMFDRVTVTVMVNVNKRGALRPEERVALLEKACAHLPNVRVDRWDGLLADYMKKNGENCVLRGVRGEAEYSAERLAAATNRMLYPGMETMLMFCSETLHGISSSAVREIAAFGGDISSFVPGEIAEEIMERLSNKG